MNKKILRIFFLNLLATICFVMPSYSANLKLEITASRLKNRELNYLKVDYQIGSATNIILKPFSYGLIMVDSWMGPGLELAFEPNNTLHLFVDENGAVYPNHAMNLRIKKAKELTIRDSRYSCPQYFRIGSKNVENTRHPNKFKTNNKYFRFCLVNVKNEGYIVSNLYSFRLNSNSEIYDAKTITWSEMPEAAQKSMETLIITKAKELKETFTPEIIINQINHWQEQ